MLQVLVFRLLLSVLIGNERLMEWRDVMILSEGESTHFPFKFKVTLTSPSIAGVALPTRTGSEAHDVRVWAVTCLYLCKPR